METYKFWLYHWEETTYEKAFLRQPLTLVVLLIESLANTLSDVILKLPSYQKASTLIVVKDE